MGFGAFTAENADQWLADRAECVSTVLKCESIWKDPVFEIRRRGDQLLMSGAHELKKLFKIMRENPELALRELPLSEFKVLIREFHERDCHPDIVKMMEDARREVPLANAENEIDAFDILLEALEKDEDAPLDLYASASPSVKLFKEVEHRLAHLRPLFDAYYDARGDGLEEELNRKTREALKRLEKLSKSAPMPPVHRRRLASRR